ncbi:hypothetical protein [Cytobacillus oceanisediminis]|uniref:hypothetical protein n=1 Tax=Cytobacillus oceanisediminis TaxID=665099 RepID=UPI00203F09A5|nr:hypothetical protein [Cytobacillus oceanisediminis]MCM3405924.1 hypothetical protein [Cytobacillus oceanisediminis]
MILDLLRSDGSIVVNKNLVHAVGLDAAVLYSELISKQKYFEERGQLTDDGFFFNTIDNIKLDTGLGEKPQRTAIKKLEQLGLIKTDKRGLPAKRYFYVIDNEQLISSVLMAGRQRRLELDHDLKDKNTKKKELHPSINNSSSQTAELDQPDGKINNTKINNNNLKELNKGLKKGLKQDLRQSVSFKYYKNKYSIRLDAIECIEYYLELYKYHREMDHPRLKEDQWHSVVEDLFDVNGVDVDDTSLMDMIDKHFETKYRNCDYNILHFMSGNIRELRMYEVAY